MRLESGPANGVFSRLDEGGDEVVFAGALVEGQAIGVEHAEQAAVLHVHDPADGGHQGAFQVVEPRAVSAG